MQRGELKERSQRSERGMELVLLNKFYFYIIVYMALLRTLCWALIFILRLPPGSSLASILNRLTGEYFAPAWHTKIKLQTLQGQGRIFYIDIPILYIVLYLVFTSEPRIFINLSAPLNCGFGFSFLCLEIQQYSSLYAFGKTA